MLSERLDLVAVEEKFELKPYLFLKGELTWPYVSGMSEPAWIKRNLIDDTFDVDIFLHEIPMTGHGTGSSFLNIDNSHQISQNFQTTFPRPLLRHTYHRSQFNNRKLRSTKMIAFGVRRTYAGKARPIDYVTYILTPHFYYLVSEKTLLPGQALYLKFPKKIAFKIPWEDGHGDRRFNFKTGKLKRSIPITQIQYNHMFVVPSKIDPWKPAQVLAKIYVHNDDGTLPTFDHFANSGFLKTSALANNQKLVTYFEGSKQPIQTNLRTNQEAFTSFLVGRILTFQTTFYDYQTRQVKIGSGLKAQIGDQVPWSFHGTYQRELVTGLNGVYTRFALTYITKIEKPILDAYHGLIRLLINEYYSPKDEVKKSRYFRLENQKILSDYLKQKGRTLNLEVLRRLSEK